MSARVLNFGAGPGALPESVLATMRDEMLDYRGTGMSVAELSHRSKAFLAILEDAERDLRTLLHIPASYHVLFMTGGGTAQFAAVPLNLAGAHRAADYIVTGTWSRAAVKEAEKFVTPHVVATSAADGTLPPANEWKHHADSSYVYVCTNETVNGTLFDPAGTLVPSQVLVADMSSELLTRRIDVTQYGCIFAGAQKNLGMSGVTVVIVRADLLKQPSPHCPTVLDYALTAKNSSNYNTPPTYAIYTAGLVFKWCLAAGGVEAMEKLCSAKAACVYDVLDRYPHVFEAPVHRSVRSRTNVVFRFVGGDAKQSAFLKRAAELHMIGLEGHRSVGGVRVSLYNAVSLEAAQSVAALMEQFAREQ